jgi:hypothetical protein
MIPCVPLFEDGTDVVYWGVSFGANKAITQVFVDEVVRTADFFPFMWPHSGKNYYQVLLYTGGAPYPTRDSIVSCDVEGLTTLPDGTGTLITNPVAQIRHVLANFVYGTGDVRPFAAWAAEAGKPIASAIFDEAETFFEDRAWLGGFSIISGLTGRDILGGWCNSYNAAPFFSQYGGIAAKPRDPSNATIYYDDRHVSQMLKHAKGPLTLSTLRVDPVSDLGVNYLFDEVRGAYVSSANVQWRRSGAEVVEEPFDLLCGRRYAG